MYINVDISDAERELDRLVDGFDADNIAEFDVVLAEQFTGTQRQVHLVTGSLRASGRMDSTSSRKKWEGEISYGGESGGFPNDPVDYAEYEYKKDGSCPGGNHDAAYPYVCPGGTHNFLAPAEETDTEYREPIMQFLRGE